MPIPASYYWRLVLVILATMMFAYFAFHAVPHYPGH